MINTFCRCAFVGLLPKFEYSISCLSMCVSLVFQTQSKVKSWGVFPKAFLMLLLTINAYFINTTFTEKVMYICIPLHLA